MGSSTYIVPGLDVGSSMAMQSHHIGVTTVSGCDQGGVSILSETNTRLKSYYERETYCNEIPERELIL